ncbi:uncharacterized protein FPRO_08722 [Fusarium proliferatum ET1]|uniref:Uncharacterized protein n=1 Tax=Fusarium proliferatum (strain ET1) TaxID=1227346 RepID=A0A1L7W3Y9_FUSPR|nr:uncharacterized protein FPRO_08722 [Fusarium proliferatum ET1]CZR47348.1 uncharacterized protein FPRO_08722 [Fusarium proliferatum ET1]
MAPPCLPRLLLIFLVGLTHVIAHPVNKDDSAELGSVNVKGSPDLKWKPKSEKHDHLQTHAQHGSKDSTTIVYHKLTATTDGKDVSKDKPDENVQEESTKTEQPAEFSSKHDENMGATHKHMDLERHEHKKHEDENIKYKNKSKVQPDLFKPYRSNRTSAYDNKKSETTKQWKDNSIDKIKNSESYEKFGEKQQIKPTDHKYVKPQRENRVNKTPHPMVGEDSMTRLKKPYDNVFAEGRRREEQEKLKNDPNKKQDSKAKLQTENKDSKKKPETKTNTASERPMPTRSSLFDNAVAIEINNFTAKEPVSSHFDSLKSKLTISKIGHKEKNQDKLYIAPGKTENLDKAKLSIETEETNEKTKESVKTYKTPHQEKDKEINKEPKVESQKDLKSSKDKHSDQGEESLTPRRPTGHPIPDYEAVFTYLRKLRRQRARERYLRMLLEKNPVLKAKLREKYPNHPMLKDRNPRRNGSIIPT